MPQIRIYTPLMLYPQFSLFQCICVPGSIYLLVRPHCKFMSDLLFSVTKNLQDHFSSSAPPPLLHLPPQLFYISGQFKIFSSNITLLVSGYKINDLSLSFPINFLSPIGTQNSHYLVSLGNFISAIFTPSHN